ncbi:DUF2786 domain-containing protein [Enterococcus wangshanyuanii]|uniref:DUF2786 domain-containing protein n=1 Tax=Enterococcus wangshanyuanii TaxID=2005703 RepID=A0ABQ1PTX3_9ENTE|nr:DUF2786 domain-containing protein [Enterococcus wangshanyuanii]GGD03560.1 hypothetical protein GCM10011573_36270 [Enterococcus wangshanyuanii]
MDNKRKDKIQRLLALANDANDAESMSALAKAQELMLEYKITENDIFTYTQKLTNDLVDTVIVYEGKPQKWLYRLARIIAKNFRVKFYYEAGTPVKLKLTGLSSDLQIAEITFQYASGSISYCAKKFMQQPEIKRKRKRKWQLKQDYIQGYLVGLENTLDSQVLTNGYELALQLPEAVATHLEGLELVKGKGTSHTVKDIEAYHSGYQEGVKFRRHEQLNC